MTHVAIAVVEHAGRFLVGRRPNDVPLAGLAEFPGGKVEASESPAAAAARECREETGLAVRVVEELTVVEHEYPHGRLTLHFLRCEPVDPQTLPRPPFRWLDRAELAACEFPPANAEVVRRLLADGA